MIAAVLFAVTQSSYRMTNISATGTGDKNIIMFIKPFFAKTFPLRTSL